MADLSDLSFNANEIKQPESFNPLPVGEYVVSISETERRETSKGSGELIAATFDVLEGPHQGRKLWCNYNIINQNETAQQIGRADLAALARAVGLSVLKQTEQLHDKPLRIIVGIEKRKDTGELQNRIKAYHPLSQFSGATPATRSASPTNGNRPPWVKDAQ